MKVYVMVYEDYEDNTSVDYVFSSMKIAEKFLISEGYVKKGYSEFDDKTYFSHPKYSRYSVQGIEVDKVI